MNFFFFFLASGQLLSALLDKRKKLSISISTTATTSASPALEVGGSSRISLLSLLQFTSLRTDTLLTSQLGEFFLSSLFSNLKFYYLPQKVWEIIGVKLFTFTDK